VFVEGEKAARNPGKRLWLGEGGRGTTLTTSCASRNRSRAPASLSPSRASLRRSEALAALDLELATRADSAVHCRSASARCSCARAFAHAASAEVMITQCYPAAPESMTAPQASQARSLHFPTQIGGGSLPLLPLPPPPPPQP
jgi:hypothetical protein